MSEQPQVTHASPRDFAAAFRPEGRGLDSGPVVHRWGVVTAVQASPPRLNVRVSGETTPTTGLPYMAGVSYTVGDTVRVVEGVRRYVDGRIAR